MFRDFPKLSSVLCLRKEEQEAWFYVFNGQRPSLNWHYFFLILYLFTWRIINDCKCFVCSIKEILSIFKICKVWLNFDFFSKTWTCGKLLILKDLIFFNSYLGLWYGEVWKKFKNSFYFQKLQVWLNFEFNMELQKITKFGPFKNILNYAIFHSHLCHKKCRDKNGSDLAQSKWLEESVKILASSDRYFWGRAGGQMIIILIRKFLLYLRSFWGWL